MSEYPLFNLFANVFWAGLLSFGGLAAVLSTMRTNMVERHGLLSNEDFTSCYGMAVGAPGPNAIFLSLIGYKVAGLLGVVVALTAWAIPTMGLLVLIGRTSSSSSNATIRAFRKALVPVVAGLLLAGSLASASTYTEPVKQWTLTWAAFAIVMLRPKWNPVWTVLGCALAGAFLLRV